ncbi:MAG: hypothetical protein ACJ77N_06265 [Chloroflexota bacterium]|jgi:hypothetical protein
MTADRRLSALDDEALGAELRGIADRLVMPSGAGLPERVTARVVAGERPRTDAWRHALARRPVRLAVLAAILALLLLAAVVTGGRLGLPGLEISVGGPTPSAAATPAGVALDLGGPVDEATAASVIGRPLPRSSDPTLGPPDAILLDRRVGAGQVAMVWAAAGGRPSPDPTGTSLVLTMFRAAGSDQLELKAVDGQVEDVVAGGPAIFIRDPHEIFIFGPGVEPSPIAVRLVGANVIAWRANGITYRLEGALTRAEAIRLATSFREG